MCSYRPSNNSEGYRSAERPEPSQSESTRVGERSLVTYGHFRKTLSWDLGGEGVLLIGSVFDKDCFGLLLPDERVSPIHAQIQMIGGKFYIQDLGLENGTFVGRARVDTHRLLKSKDILGFAREKPVLQGLQFVAGHWRARSRCGGEGSFKVVYRFEVMISKRLITLISSF